MFHGPEKPVIQGWESKTQILPEPLRLSRKRFKQMYINYLGSLDKLSQKAMPGQGDVSCFPHTGLVISEFDNLAPSSVLLMCRSKPILPSACYTASSTGTPSQDWNHPYRL